MSPPTPERDQSAFEKRIAEVKLFLEVFGTTPGRGRWLVEEHSSFQQARRRAAEILDSPQTEWHTVVIRPRGRFPVQMLAYLTTRKGGSTCQTEWPGIFEWNHFSPEEWEARFRAEEQEPRPKPSQKAPSDTGASAIPTTPRKTVARPSETKVNPVVGWGLVGALVLGIGWVCNRNGERDAQRRREIMREVNWVVTKDGVKMYRTYPGQNVTERVKEIDRRYARPIWEDVPEDRSGKGKIIIQP